MVVLIGSYLLTAVASQMFSGVGDKGVGLGNPDTADNVFAALANPVMGTVLGVLLFVAVLASAAASLQTTFIPVARTVLAMSAYEALRHRSPRSTRGSVPRAGPPSRPASPPVSSTP